MQAIKHQEFENQTIIAELMTPEQRERLIRLEAIPLTRKEVMFLFQLLDTARAWLEVSEMRRELLTASEMRRRFEINSSIQPSAAAIDVEAWLAGRPRELAGHDWVGALYRDYQSPI